MHAEQREAVRVILVDSEGLARDSFAAALEQEDDIELLAVTDSPGKAVILAENLSPDVVLTEIILYQGDALEIITSALVTRVKIIAFTGQEAERHLSRALRMGVRGYLLKSTNRHELATAIRSVARGHAYFCPPMARLLLDRFNILPPANGSHKEAFPMLSDREVDVLKDIAMGMSNHEIAQDLSLTLSTVKSHVSNVLTKLGLRDRLQAGILAHRKGLTRR